MLKQPRRRLPARFNRRVKPATLSYVKRRHKRVRGRRLERVRRTGRRVKNAASAWLRLARRWSLVLLTVAFLSLVGFIVFSPIIQVREIRVQRTEGRVDVAKIQQSLAIYFGRHLLFLQPSDVRATVRDAVPDLEEVTIRKEYPSRLFLRIELKPLIARVQIDGPPAGSGAVQRVSGSGASASAASSAPAKRYEYLTENGIYVASPVAQSGAPLPLIKIVDWPVRPVPNALLVQQELLTRMEKAERALLTEFGQKVQVRTILLRAQEIHLQAGNLTLWFDIRSPLEAQLLRFRTFLRHVGLQEVKQYVDLRLEGRVVYK